MDVIKGFFYGFFGAAGGLMLFLFYLSYGVGSIYWLWISIQLGSFLMFFIGIAGPTIIFTGPIGAYAWIFGTPDWIVNMFG